MSRRITRLIAVVAIVAVAAIARPGVSHADEDGGSVAVAQSNVQIAINIAIYCPDVTQSITQVAANITSITTGVTSDASVVQTNMQVAYNLTVYSPGASQSITQVAGNTAVVTTSSSDAVHVRQSNTQVGYNVAIQSAGSSQAIAQAASNAAAVTTGSTTLTVAFTTVVNQSNVQFAMNKCIGQPSMQGRGTWPASNGTSQDGGTRQGASAASWEDTRSAPRSSHDGSKYRDQHRLDEYDVPGARRPCHCEHPSYHSNEWRLDESDAYRRHSFASP